MTVNYTTNLALGQPVTGTESGTWGDDVNNAVTSYLDIAIAGGLVITVTTADVTLTLTQGTSVATNIGSTTAQYAILNVSGAMTAARNLILPSSSRQYVINNACTGGFLLTVKGSATTGVTLVNGEKAHVFWTGTDYSKLSNTPGGAGTFSSITNTGLTATRVVFSTTGGLETDSANLTFDGTNLTLLGGTANGVTFLNGSKVLTSGSALTFDGTNLGIGATSPAVPLSFGSLNGAKIYLRNNTNEFAIGTDGLKMIFGGYQGFTFNTGSFSGTGAMTIDSSGNVGIGTSSPVSKLQLTGASQAATSLTMLYSAIQAGSIGINSSGSMVFGLDGSTGTTTRLTIDSSGNVGIGTSSPARQLVLYGSSPYMAFQNSTTGATSGDGLQIQQAGSDAYIWNYENSFISFGTNATERARIDSSGNVGIGTSSPTAKLDVVSTAGTYAGGIRVNGTTTGNTQSGMYVVGCQGTAHYNWLVGSQFNINNGFEITPSTAANGTTFSTPRFLMDYTGSVTLSYYGVGTATFSASGVISSVSDETWKIKDGVPVDPDAMLKKLEPGYWYYNAEKKEIFGVDRQLGFYAQNVNAAIGPEAAPTPEEGKPWGYYDRSVLAVTVMSLQKALATIELLTARITALESKEIS